jgi:siroheme synthase-like protein
VTRSRKHPIVLDLRGRDVVVIGGGAVAERKIRALIEAGARAAVIAPEATAAIEAWAAAGEVRLVKRRYRRGDLCGARLAYAATGDAAANREARHEADLERVWLNVADEPSLCDFFEPAVVSRGRLTVAISTDGASPALAARMRALLERDLGPEYADLLEKLAELRDRYRREQRDLSDARDEIERMIDSLLPPQR